MRIKSTAAVEKPGGDSSWLTRPQPQSLKDVGVPEIFLANLTLKHTFYLDIFVLGDLVDRLKLPATIVTQLLDYLRKEKYMEVRGPDALRPVANSLSLANRYALTEGGKRRAGQLLEYDAYVGPAPVSLEDRLSVHGLGFHHRILLVKTAEYFRVKDA